MIKYCVIFLCFALAVQSYPVLLDQDTKDRFENVREFTIKMFLEKYQVNSIDELEESTINERSPQLDLLFTEDEQALIAELNSRLLKWLKNGDTEDYFEYMLDHAREMQKLKARVVNIDPAKYSDLQKQVFEAFLG